MRTTTRASKKLFLEQLEDRCLLSAPDPAIAFVSRVYNGGYIYNLTVMNGDGSNQAVIWSRSGPYVTSAAIQKSSWSPQSGTTSPFTGSLVVGALNGGSSSLPGDSIYRIDVTVTGNGVVQASTPTRLVANYSFQPSWSPTGNYIAFTGNNTTAPGQTVTQGGIYLVPPTGGTPTLVVADADPIHDVAAYPTWSPDGTSIAYE